MLKWWYAIDESAIIHIKTCTHFVDMWYIWYLYDALHDDKYRCLNECVTAKMQLYHLSLIESGIINVSLSDQHFQSIIFSVFCNFSDLIHFAHETWLHFTLLCRKIFESKRLQWYCFWFYILILQKVFCQIDCLTNWTFCRSRAQIQFGLLDLHCKLFFGRESGTKLSHGLVGSHS